MKWCPHLRAGGWTFEFSLKSHSVHHIRVLVLIQVFLNTLGCVQYIFGRLERPEWVPPTRHTDWKNRQKMALLFPFGPLRVWRVLILFGDALLCETRSDKCLFATFVWNTSSLHSTTKKWGPKATFWSQIQNYLKEFSIEIFCKIFLSQKDSLTIRL